MGRWRHSGHDQSKVLGVNMRRGDARAPGEETREQVECKRMSAVESHSRRSNCNIVQQDEGGQKLLFSVLLDRKVFVYQGETVRHSDMYIGTLTFRVGPLGL